jgi:hypothetical protein
MTPQNSVKLPQKLFLGCWKIFIVATGFFVDESGFLIASQRVRISPRISLINLNRALSNVTHGDKSLTELLKEGRIEVVAH